MLVVIQYIVEYCACIKLKMAKAKLQTEPSLQQKSEVLLGIQKGESQRKLAEQYGVSKTTIVNIKKNEHSIINSVESNCSQNRRALQFEVASEDDVLENKANIPVHENIASTAEGILEDIMTGRVQEVLRP